MVVEGLPVRKGSIPGVANGSLTIDISADRLVVWTVTESQHDISDAVVQDEDKPLEIYMEGHVVFREGERIVYADRMYYDAQHHVGTVLDAEMLTPAPGYEGKLRVHAAELQIIAKDHFRAQDAWFTPSRLGLPRVRVQASQAEFEEIPVFDPVTGAQMIDPRTGQPVRKQMVSAQNDVVYVEDVPIFYWPTFATDLSDPTFFLRRILFVENGVFGTQILTDWAAYQLLGIKDRPQGTDWTLSLNYMSARGLSEGTEFVYDRDDFFGLVKGKVAGKINFWGIEDRGTDNLGEGRSSVLPEPDVPYRFRFIEQHRQDLGEGFTFTAEVGKISDRNFLLEYFKPDWDEQKDPTTDLDLTLRRENMSMSIMGEARLDNFVTGTQWLPRFDHYLLGESLPGVPLTWFEHTSLGYGQFKVATLPSAAAGDEAVSHLPWEPQNFSGGRFVSRNELDLPVELGPLKVVPYALGELGYWGEDIDGQPLTRAYYQAGIRATLPMWAVDSEAESDLWNVHGLAHKVEFQAEYFHAQANQSMTPVPALRSAGRQPDRGLPPPLRGQHLRFSGRSAPLDARTADEIRRALLCPAQRHGGLGHRAEHGDRRRLGRGPPGRPRALADEARPGGQPPHHRLDRVRHGLDALPQRQSRQLRHEHRPDGLQLRVARGRSPDAALRRHLRFLRPRAEDRHGGHVPHAPAAGGVLPGLPRPRGPDQQRGAGHVVQLLDEPQVDHDLRHGDRPETTGELQPYLPVDSRGRIAAWSA